MILVDTSAWVEFLRDSDHPVVGTLTDLLKRDEDLATTEVVVMELLAGAKLDADVSRLRARLLAFPFIAVEGLADYEAAALLYRACRRGGETIRSLTDCLIAAVAIRSGSTLLHVDRDFDAIARHTDLAIVALGPR